MSEQQAQAPVRVGDVLSGKFQVERILGMGGMGVVVAARHLKLDQRVALKFMLPPAMADRDAAERFTREARAVAKLRSEYIPRVLDVGTLDDGAPYIVMELLEGQDVANMLESGPLPIGQAVGIVLHACAAVAEAHAVGIVHRDLKPRNLFMTRDVEGKPLVKVLDFGISKELGGIDGSATPNVLTRTAMMLGSPHYMSPEQLKSSRDVDARADVWSLGVCLFELLTKQMPFSAPSIAELCAIVLSQKAPHVRAVRSEVPNEIDAVLMRCLEKQPGDRFRSVAELATVLEPFADAWARPAAERARNVMKTSQRGAIVDAAAPSPASSETLATGPTVATWDTSAAGVRPRRTWPLLVVGAAAAAIALSVGGFMLAHHPVSSSAASAAPSPTAPTASNTSAATTAAPVVTASVTLAPMPSATASAAPSTTKAAVRPMGSAKPQSEDKLLEGRN